MKTHSEHHPGSGKRSKPIAKAVMVSAIVLAVAAPAQANLAIQTYFDDSVTAEQQQQINNAIGFYTSNFIDDINVKIEFVTNPSTVTEPDDGGASSSSIYLGPSAAVLNALKADANSNPGNLVLAGALPNFGSGNTAQQFFYTSANCRAIGGGCAGTKNGVGSFAAQTGLDGIVWIGADGYGDTSTILHEINEVLGIGGPSTVLGGPLTVDGKSTLGMLDPYRYKEPGVASLSTSDTVTAYLSLDGGETSIAYYNQSGGNSDFGDFTNDPCYVQSFKSCANVATQSLTSPEGLALQAIGYDVAAVPEPDTYLMSVAGLITIGALSRRRQA